MQQRTFSNAIDIDNFVNYQKKKGSVFEHNLFTKGSW